MIISKNFGLLQHLNTTGQLCPFFQYIESACRYVSDYSTSNHWNTPVDEVLLTVETFKCSLRLEGDWGAQVHGAYWKTNHRICGETVPFKRSDLPAFVLRAFLWYVYMKIGTISRKKFLKVMTPRGKTWKKIIPWKFSSGYGHSIMPAKLQIGILRKVLATATAHGSFSSHHRGHRGPRYQLITATTHNWSPSPEVTSCWDGIHAVFFQMLALRTMCFTFSLIHTNY